MAAWSAGSGPSTERMGFLQTIKKSHGNCLSARDGPERLACTPADEAGVEKDKDVSFGCWFALLLVNEVANLVKRKKKVWLCDKILINIFTA